MDIAKEKALEAEKASYNAAMTKWKEKKKVEDERSNRLETLLNEKAEAVRKELIIKRDEDLAQKQTEIEEQKKNLSDADAFLNSLGAFKIREKKETKQRIEQIKGLIAKYEGDLPRLKSEHNRKIGNVMSDIKIKHEAELRRTIENELPLPEEPKKPESILEEERKQQEAIEAEKKKKQEAIRREGLKADILAYLSDGKERYPTEFCNNIKGLKDNYSLAKELAEMLADSYLIQRVGKKYKLY